MEELSLLNLDDSYELINFDESLCINNSRHSAHCCIYSPNSFPIFKVIESKAYISMQMRFDGRLGFPGGEIDEKDVNIHIVVDELNRELVEETNLEKKYFVTKENYCITHRRKGKNDCFHFFSKEVPIEDFLEIEKNSLKAKDFGKEVLGIIRVPLFTMQDQVRGFPRFLLNGFAGCAKHQLLYFLLNKKLVSFDYVKGSILKLQT